MSQQAAFNTDTSDMLIPHNLFRSALGSAPQMVSGVSLGDGDRRVAVSSYLDNVLRFLDAHHEGEDAILWPVLGERCPAAARLLARMADQHTTIHGLREKSGELLDGWRESGDPDIARRLVSALASLAPELAVHFGEEEAEILPLASANMSPEEWGALPGHAMAHFTGDKLWLILGLVLETMTDEERAFVLTLLPPPVVDMWTTTGRASFDDFMAVVRPAH